MKVVYYNTDDTIAYEKSLLKDWGVTDLELVHIIDKNSEHKCASLHDADGVVVVYDTITRSLLEKCPNLKCASVQSIGYNNIDVAAASDFGVCCTNAPGFCAPEVALHVTGLIIDLARKITFFDKSVRSGQWNPFLGYPLERIEGKTVGLVFFGEIPQKLVPMLQGIGLEILVYAPTKTEAYLAQWGCKKASSLDELLMSSDFVSLHCPLIKEVTYHLIGEAELKKMKKTAFLINTSRGAVVDEKALVKALDQGLIQGAGIDVIEDEVNEKSDLFRFNERVVITPHAAFISEDSFYGARRIALEQLVQCLVKKERPSNLINTDVIMKA